ncbi:MAG: hypothetical protein RL021_1817, partial [Bacteroidota bacterium]
MRTSEPTQKLMLRILYVMILTVLLQRSDCFGEIYRPFLIDPSVTAVDGFDCDSTVFLRLDKSVLRQILGDKPMHMTLEIPSANPEKFYKLEIDQKEVLENPSAITITAAEGVRSFPAPTALHFRGHVEGDSKSIAAFSFFDDEILGIFSFSTTGGNYNISKVWSEPSGTLFALFDDIHIKERPAFNCFAVENPAPNRQERGGNSGNTSNSVKCVKVFADLDYYTYTTYYSGNTTGAVNYVSGLFNQVITVYNAENISVTLSGINVWMVQDPYDPTSTSTLLTTFQNYRNSAGGAFTGDLAHLLTRKSVGGGRAYLNALCGTSKYGVSGSLGSTSTIVPYSWNVNVVAHELGHNFSSQHTHDCAWNGNNTPIDGCGPAAGYPTNCPTGPLPPSSGGTIMSYCHLLSSVGINLTNGFGQQPGDRIRTYVNGSACLVSCSCTPTVTLTNSSSGPFCPNAQVTFTANATNGGAGATYTFYKLSAGSPIITFGPTTSNTYTTTVSSSSIQVYCIMTSNAPCASTSTATSNTITLSQTTYDNWTVKQSPTGPGPRSGAVGFSIGSKGYIGTGGGTTGRMRDFWEYDPATNAWTQKADFGGTARAYAAGFSIGSKGYVGTGYDGTMRNDFWEFDPAANTWIQRSNFPGTARLSAVGMAINNKGYIGTGTDNNSVTRSFYEYDPALNSWTQKADFGGTARDGAAGFVIGNKGYLGTGMDATGAKQIDFWEFDPTLNFWTRKADFGGAARSNAISFAIGGKGYIGCGGTATTKVSDVWMFDPSINAWSRKKEFGGTARSLSVGFAIGNKGYIGTGNGPNATADFWEYDPAASLSISMTSTPVSCPTAYDDFADGTISGTVIGGALSFSANWTCPSYFNNFSTTYNSRSFSRTQVEHGIHTIQITSSDGCSATASIAVVASTPPTVSISSTATSICSGSSTTLSANPSGNTYLWSNGATTQSITTGAAGTYTVTVTAPYGCTGTASKTVTVTPSVTPSVSITATPNIAITPGTTVNFTATPVNGGSAPTYLWLRNGTVVSSLGNTYSTSALANGDIIQCAMTSNATCVTQAQVASNAIQMTVLSTVPRFLVVDVTANRACYYDAAFNLVSSSGLSTNVLNGFTNAADVAATSTATYV